MHDVRAQEGKAEGLEEQLDMQRQSSECLKEQLDTQSQSSECQKETTRHAESELRVSQNMNWACIVGSQSVK